MENGERGVGSRSGAQARVRTSERVLVLQDLAEVQDAEVRRRRRALVLPLCRPGGAVRCGRAVRRWREARRCDVDAVRLNADADAGRRGEEGRADGRTDG